MSVLIVLLPPRGRAGPTAPAPAPAPSEWTWMLSPDGLTAGRSGRGAPASFPRADTLAAVPADADLVWHRIALPKAPGARLAQALQGVLEEQLLEDAGPVHFAVGPDAKPGQPCWVAAVDRRWLAGQLAALEAGGRTVDRVLPPGIPGADPVGHFATAAGADGEGAPLRLHWSDANGVVHLGLDGTLARVRVASVGDQPVRWTATPAAAAAAEAWLGHPVAVVVETERALQALRSGWNLRQGELAPRHRGATLLREAWRAFWSPGWRAARLGVFALLVVNLAGLNAWAWHEQRALQGRRAEMDALLRSSFPQVRAVLDAPRQMTRETTALRVAAGRPGDDDLETLLAVVAGVWPEDEDPVPTLRFEPGRLTLGVPDWDAAAVEAVASPLQAAGWTVQRADGQLTVSRAPAGGQR